MFSHKSERGKYGSRVKRHIGSLYKLSRSTVYWGICAFVFLIIGLIKILTSILDNIFLSVITIVLDKLML